MSRPTSRGRLKAVAVGLYRLSNSPSTRKDSRSYLTYENDSARNPRRVGERGGHPFPRDGHRCSPRAFHRSNFHHRPHPRQYPRRHPAASRATETEVRCSKQRHSRHHHPRAGRPQHHHPAHQTHRPPAATGTRRRATCSIRRIQTTPRRLPRRSSPRGDHRPRSHRLPLQEHPAAHPRPLLDRQRRGHYQFLVLRRLHTHLRHPFLHRHRWQTPQALHDMEQHRY